MSLIVTAILVAVLSWWFATGAIILVARWGQKHETAMMLFMSVIAAFGLYGLYQSSSDNSVAGVYHAFASALALWAWHEAAFLLGVVTGPRKKAMSEGAVGFTRFKQAYEAIRDHELSLFATLLVIIVALAGGENHMGIVTFALLWVMRLSTKLNVFLGAPNAISDILPERLDYLTSYFRTDRTSPFFWYSMTFAMAIFVGLIGATLNTAQDSALVALVLLAAFAALAVIEHLFLVLPVRDAALWAWFVPARNNHSRTFEAGKISKKIDNSTTTKSTTPHAPIRVKPL